jgi:hypothetical protein
VRTPAKEGMLAKLVNQPYSGGLTAAGTLLTTEMTAATGTKGTSWMSTAAGPPESGRK